MKPCIRTLAALCVAFACGAFPAAAFAASGSSSTELQTSSVLAQHVAEARQAAALQQEADQAAARAATQVANKVLPYDSATIDAVGTQEGTGHTVCCCEFACAYADAIIDGTINDHAWYGCGNCTWPNWGGGDSSYRVVGDGSDAQVLREAYDQISSGKPTVIHVTHAYGEHWIALIGYTGANDPDNLTLDNFIALDPWDGNRIVAGSEYALYGDGCEHVSER